MGFVQASIKHIHIELVLVGLLLLSLCCVLIGSPIARLIRRIVVLPLVQLGHHVFLVGAGVMIALFFAALSSGQGAATLTTLVSGVAILLLGGAEMQAAESVCRLSDEDLGRHVPVTAIILFALVATVLFTVLLLANMGSAH